jgi:hypothetical protein
MGILPLSPFDPFKWLKFITVGAVLIVVEALFFKDLWRFLVFEWSK